MATRYALQRKGKRSELLVFSLAYSPCVRYRSSFFTLWTPPVKSSPTVNMRVTSLSGCVMLTPRVTGHCIVFSTRTLETFYLLCVRGVTDALFLYYVL